LTRKSALAVVVAMVVLAALFHTIIFGALGDFLVRSEPPQKADIALVLAGDYSGNRILLAGALVRRGYVPKALVSGPAGLYGEFECDPEIHFAVSHGFQESYFLRLENHARSTQEEAREDIPELRRLHATRILLVTSDFHTRRAGKIFRTLAPDLTFYPVAAPDEDFTPHGWWRDRQGRKVFLIEWLKTIAEWFGL
jgi:uncharacterized SAM-binding protein YcdF (DUF218 family)